MVTGEPSYGRDETAAVPEYESTSQQNSAGSTSPARQGASQAQQTASRVGNQVQQAASTVAGQAADTAQAVMRDQRHTAAQSLNSVSHAVSQVGNQLRQNDQTAPIAGVMDAAATQIQHAADYLQHHNVQQMVDEVRGFARREPAIFLGGAFVLGLLAARFIKASPEAPSGQYETGSYQPGGYRPQTAYNRPNGVYGYGRPYSSSWRTRPGYRQPGAYGTSYGSAAAGEIYREGNGVDTGASDANTVG